jgi:predicted metalloprotease with PDZ domain
VDRIYRSDEKVIFEERTSSQDVRDVYATLVLDMSRDDISTSFGLRISDKSGRFMVTFVMAESPADYAGFMPQVPSYIRICRHQALNSEISATNIHPESLFNSCGLLSTCFPN